MLTRVRSCSGSSPRLPEADVPAALRAVAELAAQRDPFLTHVLAAEEDDEELNEVGQRMLEEAREDSEAGADTQPGGSGAGAGPLRPTLRLTTRALRDLNGWMRPMRLRVLGRSSAPSKNLP